MLTLVSIVRLDPSSNVFSKLSTCEASSVPCISLFSEMVDDHCLSLTDVAEVHVSSTIEVEIAPEVDT